jgi:hypothetical protein
VSIDWFHMTDAFFSFSSGLKALNKIRISSYRNHSGDGISFVTVFTTYSSGPAVDGKVPSGTVTVGNHSYDKVERSMAVLKSFISFIQVHLPFRFFMISQVRCFNHLYLHFRTDR